MGKLGLIAGGLLLAGGVILGNIAVAVGGVAVLLWSAFTFSVRQNKVASQQSLIDTVRPEDRARLRPLIRLHEEIRQVVASNQSSTAIAVVGSEALIEADRITQHVAEMLRMRARVRKPLSESRDPNQSIERLKAELETAQSDMGRQALEAALAARSLEGDHYEQVKAAIDRIDVTITQAEASLAEMKARLSAAAAQMKDEAASEDLRESLTRMRSLDTSLDEAEEFLRVHL